MKQKTKKYPYTSEDGIVFHRDYCFLINGEKYNRNFACKRHDNLYGINGGGSEEDRKKADFLFYEHLKKNKDPMAYLAYLAVRIFGILFFNYKTGFLWKGQFLKKLCFWRKK